MIRDAFLSDEDLDIRNLSEEELFRVWDEWLLQAQATNDYDVNYFSHGVFTLDDEMDSGTGVPFLASPKRQG